MAVGFINGHSGVATSSTNSTSYATGGNPSADQPVTPDHRGKALAPVVSPADAQGRALANVDWLADQLGMSYDAALWHIRKHRIPVVRFGRLIRVPTKALEALAERALSLGGDAQLVDAKK